MRENEVPILIANFSQSEFDVKKISEWLTNIVFFFFFHYFPVAAKEEDIESHNMSLR